MVKQDVVNLTPQATAPVGATEGEVYYDSVTKKLNVHDGTSQKVIGPIIPGTTYLPSNAAYLTSSGSANNIPATIFSHTIPNGGFTVRIGVYVAAPAGGGWTGYYNILVNGVSIKSGSTVSTTQVFFSIDRIINSGETITITINSNGANGTASGNGGIYGADSSIANSIY